MGPLYNVCDIVCTFWGNHDTNGRSALDFPRRRGGRETKGKSALDFPRMRGKIGTKGKGALDFPRRRGKRETKGKSALDFPRMRGKLGTKGKSALDFPRRRGKRETKKRLSTVGEPLLVPCRIKLNPPPPAFAEIAGTFAAICGPSSGSNGRRRVPTHPWHGQSIRQVHHNLDEFQGSKPMEP